MPNQLLTSKLVRPCPCSVGTSGRNGRRFNAALRDPDLQKRLSNLGAVPTGGTPQQMAATVSRETAKWRKLISERKIKVD